MPLELQTRITQNLQEAEDFLIQLTERRRVEIPFEHLLLAKYILKRADEMGMAPFAISDERLWGGTDVISILLVRDRSAAVIQVVDNLRTTCRIRVLPHTVSWNLSDLLSASPTDQDGEQVVEPKKVALELPRLYSHMPLVCMNDKAFAPWVVAEMRETLDHEMGVSEMAQRITDYIHTALQYGQGGTSFPGTETDEGWIVLGYVPLRRFGDLSRTARVRLLISSGISWQTTNNTVVTGLPVDWEVPFLYPRPSEDCCLAGFLAKNITVYHTFPDDGSRWEPRANPVVLLGDITPEQFIADPQNAKHVYRLGMMIPKVE